MPAMNEPVMTCAQVREALDALTAQRPEIPASETAVHTHLHGCDECRTQYADARAWNAMLQAWTVPAPRTNVQARVLAAIAQEERTQRDQQARESSVAGRLFAALAARVRIPAALAWGLAALLVLSLAANALLLSNRLGSPTGPLAFPLVPQYPTVVATQGTPGSIAVPLQVQALPSSNVLPLSPFDGPGTAMHGAAAMPLGAILILAAPPLPTGSTQPRETI